MNKALAVPFTALFLAAGVCRADEVIKVASASMRSGPQSRLGERVKLGAQLAIEEAQPIGRALMQDPALLLLDEPTLGLAPVLVEALFETLTRLNQAGKTMLLVEQNAWHALQIAQRAYVLPTGLITKHGLARELAHDPEVKRAYLGGD